eukprot:5896114-Prymnesium_polylepis.1
MREESTAHLQYCTSTEADGGAPAWAGRRRPHPDADTGPFLGGAPCDLVESSGALITAPASAARHPSAAKSPGTARRRGGQHVLPLGLGLAVVDDDRGRVGGREAKDAHKVGRLRRVGKHQLEPGLEGRVHLGQPLGQPPTPVLVAA